MQLYDTSNSYILFSTTVLSPEYVNWDAAFRSYTSACGVTRTLETGNVCGERIYVVARGVHTTNLFS